MKALAVVFTASLIAMPAFADSIRERHVITRESLQVTPVPQSQGAIVLEQRAARDPFPEQGSDNPSGNLSEGDLRSEGHEPETRIGANQRTRENVPGQLDPQEANRSATITVVPMEPSVAAPVPGAIILDEQTASDPFPEQGSDNPSGNLSEGDLRSESQGPETRMGYGNPRTQENTPGQLDPHETRR
jgi:hypothetical protein